MFKVPSLEVGDFIKHLSAAVAIGWDGFIFVNQVEGVLSAGQHVIIDVSLIIEFEILRQVAGDESSFAVHLTAVTYGFTRKDF